MTRRKRGESQERTDALDASLAAAKRVLEDAPAKVQRLRVSTLVERHADTYPEFAEAVYTLAAGEKLDYTAAQWQRVLDRLDGNKTLVREYVANL